MRILPNIKSALAIAIFLACGVATLGTALAQSKLPACPARQTERYHNCFGTYEFPSGDKYVGEWRDDKQNGQGAYTFASGQTYVGEFRDGKRNGKGTFSFPSGETYVGEFVDGKYDGQGTLTFPNGQKYVGQFKDDKRNGRGTFSFPSGETYVGEFKDGKYHGQGSLTFASGQRYVGEFREDKRSGRGIYMFPSGERYSGEFKDGKYDGQGTLSFPSGQKYVGEFRDGKRNGQGTFSFPSGEKYVGEFKDGNYDGRGTLIFANGEKYGGEWKDDKRDGLGILYAPDGSVKQAGLWAKGAFVRTAAVPGLQSQQQQGVLQQQQPPLPGPVITPTPGTRRVALVIGNTNYKSQTPLDNPRNDADLIASALRSTGFQQVIVKYDLTQAQMLAAMRDFSDLADKADWAVVYYSGHGIAFGGANFMIPVDARLKADKDIALEAVSVGTVSNAISGAKALRLLILDMCRVNPFLSQMARSNATRALSKGLAPPIETDAGEYTVFAAKDGQEALDGDGKNSPFAEALARRLSMPNVDVRRVFDYVRDDVMRSTNRRQQPFTYGSLPPADYFFVQK